MHPNIEDPYKLFIAYLTDMIKYEVWSIRVFKIVICHTSEGF